jgi:predicted RNA methylase
VGDGLWRIPRVTCSQPRKARREDGSLPRTDRLPRPTWDAPFQWAAKLTPSRTTAARLANLAIAHELSIRRLFDSSPFPQAADWPDSVIALALSEVAISTANTYLWGQLRDAAAVTAASVRDTSGLDCWVEAFQSFDPHRKTRGAYATPLPLAETLAGSALRDNSAKRILDPAAGTGSLLLAVQRLLVSSAQSQEERREHTLRLFGVEIDPNARELACLLLWIGSYGAASLEEIAKQVVVDNALTRDWKSDGLFDAVIMNPPWESLRHTSSDEELDSHRRTTLARLQTASLGSDSLPPLFTRQGKGDYNLYKMFVELAPHLLRINGRLAALIPAAFASDLGMSRLRSLYFSAMRIERWTSFENLSGYFSIDSRYKFAVMQAVRDPAGTDVLEVRSFASLASEVAAKHVPISRAERVGIGGPSGMIPEIGSRQELEIFKYMLERGNSFLGPQTVFGHVAYRREIDLTLDKARGRFWRLDGKVLESISPDGIYTVRADGITAPSAAGQLVPLIEGRMVSHYDFFAKSWVSGSGRTAQWTYSDRRKLVECRPQFLIGALDMPDPARVALCDVTSATNTRTVLASWVPATWQCGNTAPTLRFDSARQALAATAVLNSMTFDWLARRVVAGLHLNKFYLECLVWPTLTDSQIDTLADEAFRMLLANPRFASIDRSSLGFGPRRAEPMLTDYVAAAAMIEEVVAQGFGLDIAMLDEILSGRPTDRRGLWRHFASDPNAEAIKALLMDNYGAAAGVRSRLG